MTKLRGKIMQIIQLSTRKKQALALSILATVIALTFFATKAWAMDKDSAAASSAKTSTYEEYKIIKLAPSTTTSYPEIPVSSTTTTKPIVLYKKPQKTTSATTVPTPETNVPPATQAPSITGDWVAQCHLWASEAGIELPPSAISLIDKESDCDPNVKNPSSSACGIAQNIRGCDSPGYGRDPVQQLKWMHGYVFGKFGGWEQALAFWHCKGTCYFKGGSIYKTANWY